MSVIEREEHLPTNEVAQVIAMVERVAMNPDLPVERLEKMMDLQERVLDREAKQLFSRAMNAAQQEMRIVSTDLNNTQTRSKYASYGKLDKALRPIYTRHGFSLSFNTEESCHADMVRVTCDVAHTDGHSKLYRVDMPADGKGAKGGDVMTKTHAAGAAMSYGMRYLLKMIFNVAIGEDDTDGNMPVETITTEQAADLNALIDEVKADKAKFLKWAKVSQVSDIPASKYSACLKALEEKRK